jgi:predicted Zn-dependent protease with MMP-like domain
VRETGPAEQAAHEARASLAVVRTLMYVLDAFRGPIKAGLAALFAVGLLLLFLNPPSLSGAEEMAIIVGSAVGLALLTAWAFVALSGSDSMPDAEFERLVKRSEELAREPGLRAGVSDFDILVADAIDSLPPEFQELLDRTPVVVSQLGAENRAYGHYFGDTVARDDYPDRIVLYQDTLERDFGWDRDLLRAQVERTLRHELAHHLGWHERGVGELGL